MLIQTFKVHDWSQFVLFFTKYALWLKLLKMGYTYTTLYAGPLYVL